MTLQSPSAHHFACDLVFVFLLTCAYQDRSWPLRYRDSFIDQSQTWEGWGTARPDDVTAEA